MPQILRNNLLRQAGFTLIELLVVIAIIGFLATIVLTATDSARSKSRNARRLADVRQVMTALELYYNHNNGYPTATITRSWNGSNENIPDPATGATATWSSIMAIYPSAPLPLDNTPTCTTANSGYAYTGTASTYSIVFCLGATTGSLAAGAHTATQNGIQ